MKDFVTWWRTLRVERALYRLAVSGNVAAQIWWLKSHGWQDAIRRMERIHD
jgi:hypothetical protein